MLDNVTVADSNEVELGLLGCILHDPRVLPKVRFLRPDDFAYEHHAAIWSAYVDLADSGLGITFAGVKDKLVTNGALEKVGGAPYLKEVADAFITLLNTTHYAETIRDRALRRRMADLGQWAKQLAADLDAPAEEQIARISRELLRLSGEGRSTAMTAREVAAMLIESLKREPQRYSTGLPELDNSMGGGLYAGKLYAIAARKKVGKTIMLGTVSRNLGLQNIPHLFIPLETPATEIEMRNAARHGHFNSIRFLTREDPRLGFRVVEYMESQNDATIYETCAGSTFDQLRAIISRHLAQGKIKGVIIDYLQMIGGKQKNETEEYHLRAICDWLASTCRRESIWCLLAVQVNQDGNSRGGEGVRLACDQYYTLHREKDSEHAWLEMGETRYTLYQNVGSEGIPGLILNKHGPHFQDFTAMPMAYGPTRGGEAA